MKHKSNSPHVHMLMKGHDSSSSHPENILMKGHSRQHHFAGGISAAPPKFASGGGLGNPLRFAKGGHAYAEGGEADKEYGEKPLTGQLRRGGRAKREHHAWGTSRTNFLSDEIRTRKPQIPNEMKKGGRSKRQHHFWGQGVIGRIPLVGDLARDISRTVGTLDEDKFGGENYTPKSKWEAAGNLALTGHMKKGGRAKRKHHFAGEGVEGISPQQEMPRQAQKSGGRSKRSHHYWGQDVFGRLPGIGSLAESASKNAGTFDDNSYGGDAYNKRMEENRQQAKEGLGKAFNAVGGYLSKPKQPINIQRQPQPGAPVANNSVRQAQKSGGRSKRSHHYWGQDVFGRLPIVGGLANMIANSAGTLDPHQFGGAEYTADTGGRKAADIISHLGNHGAQWALSALKKGGRAHKKHRQHHAEGGSGKVRKGMMTESGHMIHHER